MIRLPGAPGFIPRLDATINVFVRAADTSGAWSLVDYTLPPRYDGPATHWHAHTTEAFYVLSGTITFELDGRVSQIGAGEVAVVPPGVVHRFTNTTDAPASFLCFLTPGGFEAYFDELATLARESAEWPPADPTAIPRLLAGHDVHAPPADGSTDPDSPPRGARSFAAARHRRAGCTPPPDP
jgi:mannose-6-phosphate isomerase-like protein (cupin superfamily)